jgi:hypothetical protein
MHREDAGLVAAEEIAAADQRALAFPVATVRAERHSIGDPLRKVANHVEGPHVRDAGRPRSRDRLTGKRTRGMQVVAPSSSGPGSGVPRAAACHSALVGKRLPAFRAAATSWPYCSRSG